MAEPFKKGRGWAFRVDIGPDPSTGKRRQVLRQGFRTKSEAAAAQAELLVRVAAKQVVTRGAVRVDEYLDQWLESQRARVRPTTLHGYRMACRRIGAKVGAVRLEHLTVTHIESMYADLLSDGLSTKTVINTHQVLRRALRDALRTGVLAANPASVAEPPKHKRRDLDAWSSEEVYRFLRATDSSEMHPLWVLLLATGMRRGEALGLRWADVDLDVGEVQIVQTRTTAGSSEVLGEPKTARSRRILALEAEHVAVLRNLHRRQASERLAVGEAYDTSHDLVFRDAIGVPYKPDRVSRSFGLAVSEAGVPKISLHGCRHTWASIALARGVAMKAVSDQLGHASITVTADVYSHVSKEVARDEVRAVTAGFLGPEI